MLVLDTDILSLLRRPDRVPTPAEWHKRAGDATLFTTVLTLREIARGIRRQRQINPDFAGALSDWARRIERAFVDRVLAFDAAAAQVWGRLTATRGCKSADLLIAAIALSRDATLVTRNTADFAPTGVRLVNPLAG